MEQGGLAATGGVQLTSSYPLSRVAGRHCAYLIWRTYVALMRFLVRWRVRAGNLDKAALSFGTS